MKRYLVYYDKTPINGIDGYDYVDALRTAKLKAPSPEYRRHLRIRLANKGLLKALANQGNF
jgi:hypothetical protein